MLEIDELKSDSSAHPVAMSITRKTAPQRLRVLHVVARLGIGGTEKGILKVVDGLGGDQFEHRLCAVRGLDANFAETANRAARAYSVGTSTPGMQFPLFRLAKIMREFRPHIVHSRNFGALDAIPAARLTGVPVVVHSEHGYELDILAGLPLRRRVLCRAFYPMADAWFAVTKELCAYHARQSWMPAQKLRVLYNGVDTNRFAPQPAEGLQVRRQLCIPEDRIVVGSVGRLVAIKDHGTLLRAAESVIQQGKNLHVLLVGNGPELPKLQSYVKNSSALNLRCTFTGASEDVPALMRVMDIFVLPSLSEGMSNTLLESMGSGLAVLASHAGGNPEVVEDGCSGRLFPPGSESTLSAMLANLVDDPVLRRTLGAAARERAVQKFSLAAMIQSYRDLYNELAERRGITGKAGT